MASSVVSAQQASEPLKYQTWVLKVPIHCEGCKRKVKKVLRKIDGVYTTAIDAQKNRVTVTGNVAVETLIKKLITRAGKQVEAWPERLNAKESKSERTKNKDKQKDPSQRDDPIPNPCEKVGVVKLSSAKNRATTTIETGPTKFSGKTSPGKSAGGEESPAMEPQRSESEKRIAGKKKKSGSNLGSAGSGAPASMGSQPLDPVDLGRTRQMAYLPPVDCNSPLVYTGDSETASMSLAPYYYVPSSPYTCPTSHLEIDRVEATYLDSLQIFSDENARGCFIM